MYVAMIKYRRSGDTRFVTRDTIEDIVKVVDKYERRRDTFVVTWYFDESLSARECLFRATEFGGE